MNIHQVFSDWGQILVSLIGFLVVGGLVLILLALIIGGVVMLAEKIGRIEHSGQRISVGSITAVAGLLLLTLLMAILNNLIT